MAKYVAPAVFINEINGLPPSVAQEPSSVTVFIGYTEKLADGNGDDLKWKPYHIHSFLQYNTVFGNTPGERYLHDAVQLFYDNGGGDCYIISAGSFDDPVSFTVLSNCLNISKNVPAQLLVMPDACLLTSQEFSTLQQQALQCCADLQDRFAILDTLPPTNNLENDIQHFRTGIGSNNLKWGAAYYPWLVLQNNKLVPPSGAIAGIYTRVDNSRGVWKAPANISLIGILDITFRFTDRQQENMNVDPDAGKSVNAIRHFTGKGFLVWGARTLAGNDNEWRYVSVRRLLTMIEQSVKKSTLWVVFEPNDANTWVKVKTLTANYLHLLWRNGALAGAKADDAFFVKTGLGETMTQADISEGRLIVEMGLAVVRPAEFIIIRFSHKLEVS